MVSECAGNPSNIEADTMCLDLVDGGAAHIASTISKIKQKAPNILVEALTPDFANKGPEVIHQVAVSGLDVFAHNVETVERCTPFVRDRRAGFEQSLRVLEEAKKGARAAGKELLTKTSIMLGVGERGDEIEETLRRELSIVYLLSKADLELCFRPTTIRRRRCYFRSIHATHQATHESGPVCRAGRVCQVEASCRKHGFPLCRKWTSSAIQLQGRRVLHRERAQEEESGGGRACGRGTRYHSRAAAFSVIPAGRATSTGTGGRDQLNTMYSICTIGNNGVSVSVRIMHLCSLAYPGRIMPGHGSN